jgi:hypothetical protein
LHRETTLFAGQFCHKPGHRRTGDQTLVPTSGTRTLTDVPDIEGRVTPPPLVVAAGLAAVEGLLVLGYGVLEAASVHADRAAMGVTTSLFFALLGLGLVTCGWFLLHGRPWARSPVVVAQVMSLGLAWNFVGGTTTWVAVVLAVVAVVVLGGLLHPASVAALDMPRDDRH